MNNQIEDLGNDSTYESHKKAGKMIMTLLQKNGPKSVKEYVEGLTLTLSKDIKDYLLKNQDYLNKLIEELSKNDLKHDYFSASTLVSLYLCKRDGSSDNFETPIYMYLRIACQLYNKYSVERVGKCMKEMSKQYYTPASPTLFNAGTTKPQMSSCFLATVGDSLNSILGTVKDYGMISKEKGAVGIDISRVRHSAIGNNGMSRGIIPMLKVFDSTAQYVDQTGKRKGAATIFLKVHHLDIYSFCELNLKEGPSDFRAYGIQSCVAIPNIFMERVLKNENWTLFCPKYTPMLNETYGREYEKWYEHYENDVSIPSYVKRVTKARELLGVICNCQDKSGSPYVIYIDSMNIKSAHKVIGYIRNMNLCLEIVEFCDDNEIPSCNLHSISLRKFVKGPYKNDIKDCYDFDKLGYICRQVVSNLNNVIDNNYYPLDNDVEEYERGKISLPNKVHRPIGVGVSGFSDMLHKLNLPIVDVKEGNWSEHTLNETVRDFNKRVFACMYYNALLQGIQESILEGSYPSFYGLNLNHNEYIDDIQKTKEKENSKLWSRWLDTELDKLLDDVNPQTKTKLENKLKNLTNSGYKRKVLPSLYYQQKLQFDLWKEEYDIYCKDSDNATRKPEEDEPLSPELWNQKPFELINKYGKLVYTIKPTWDDLKYAIKLFGLRNSLYIALMPTASTSQVLKNCESTELYTGNIYSRNTKSINCTVINRFMEKDMRHIGIWNRKMYEYIQSFDGSIRTIDVLLKQRSSWFPDFKQTSVNYDKVEFLKRKYITMFEIKQRYMLQMAADRGRYVDQSQSTNVYIESPTQAQLQSMHLFAYQLGLKTGMYYLRTKSSIERMKNTISTDMRLFLQQLIEEKKNIYKENINQENKVCYKEKGCLDCD